MRILFIGLALFYSALAQACDKVVFTGPAASITAGCLALTEVIAENSLIEVLGKYPLQCLGHDSHGIPICAGIIYLRDQQGLVDNSFKDKECYTVATMVDFQPKRRMMVALTIRRQDATCIK